MNTKMRLFFNDVYLYGFMAVIALLIALVFASHSEAQEYPQAGGVNVLPSELIAGVTQVIRFPLLGVDNGASHTTFTLGIYNASGTNSTNYLSSSASNLWTTSVNSNFNQNFYNIFFNPPLAYVGSQLIVTVTNPFSSGCIVDTARIIAANKIKESTMFTLASDIVRDTTWSVASPVIRQSSADYQSALVEEFHTERGDQNRFHVVLYDQNSSIAGFFQKGYHFWVSTYAEVLTVLGRGVPDGDVDRYVVEE